jgi:hypothetical protein
MNTDASRLRPSSTMINQALNLWLMDSDPAIRWQVMRDILHWQPEAWNQERNRLPTSGWCAQLLQLQDTTGMWNRSLYNGKWLSTTYSLYLLKLLGLPAHNPQALHGCHQLVTQGLYHQEEIRFSRHKDIQDLGVSAIVLSLCCYFGYHAEGIPRIAEFLIGRQSKEGSWLPDENPLSVNYSFETTLLVLESLLQYQSRYAADQAMGLSAAVQEGREFLIRHDLGFNQQRPAKKRWMVFSFPAYWFYDYLTVLDTFSTFDANRDRRMQTAIDLIRRKQKDDRWLLGSPHPGKTYFDMEEPGKPSRWNTLRALRVLKWWNNGAIT